MSSQSPKGSGRIPFESLEGSGSVSAWDLPDVAVAGKVVKSAKKEQQQRSQEKVESVSQRRTTPFTAEELAEISEQARKDGFEQGYAEGNRKGLKDGLTKGEKEGYQSAFQKARAEIEALQSRLRTIADRLFDPMSKQDEVVEQFVVDLALGIAKKLVCETISANPEALVNIVREALEALPKGAKNIRIYLNDDDLSLLEGLRNPMLSEWNLVADAQLSSGSVRLETQESIVDYSLETRIQQYLESVAEPNAPLQEPDLPAPDASVQSQEPQSQSAAPQSQSPAPPAQETAQPSAAKPSRPERPGLSSRTPNA